MPKNETNAEVIMRRLLKQGGRAAASDLGTSGPIMEQLIASGHVVTDGVRKTGKKGRPPVAYKATGIGTNYPTLVDPAAIRRAEAGTPQETIDRIIREVSEMPVHANCSCIVAAGPGTTEEEIRAMGIGCKSHWVCGALDAVRRRGDLHSKPQPFVEVTDRNREERLAEFEVAEATV